MMARHRPAASHSCAGGMTSHGRRSQNHMQCSCGVSQSDSSVASVAIDLRFDLVTTARLTPPPTLLFRLIAVHPPTPEGHLHSLDHPPRLLS